MNDRPTYDQLQQRVRQLEKALAGCETAAKEQASGAGMRDEIEELARIGTWDYDLKLDRLTWSDQACRNYGIDPSQVVDLSALYALIHPEDRDRHRRHEQRLIQGRASACEYRVVRPDGRVRWIWASGKAVCDDAGEPLRLVGIAQDVTDRKDLDAQLKQAEADRSEIDRLYHRLFQKAPVPLWEEDFSDVFDCFDRLREKGVTDFRRFFDAHPDQARRCIGKVIVRDVNEAAVQLHQAPNKEALLGQLDAIFSDQSLPAIKAELAALAAGQVTFEAEGEVNTLSGEPRQVHVRLWLDPQPTEGRKALLTTVDITDRKTAESQRRQLEVQLHQAQKMESIGTLAGGIAHDFNNILSAVLGYTELSLDEAETGSRLEDNLKEVFIAGQRAKELVNQILTFARRSESEKKPVQVSLMAKEVLKLLRSSLPTSIEIRHDIRSHALVMGDPGQIHQVFMNLCTNAAQAMRMDDGVLRVNLADTHLARRRIVGHTSIAPGDYIQITVADTGTGIPAAYLNSIFEPYFTTKEKGEGTGLGLAVVHGAVQGMGGAVDVESEPDKGTVFTIYLPITRSKIDPTLFAADKLPGGEEHILFVDDEAPIVRMGQRILEKLGYRVTGQTGSVAALGLFEADPAAFDLVITDMTMPGMTGDDMAAAMLKRRPDIPIILCTGYSKKMTEASVAALGIKTMAYKPIVKADLARIVRRVLDEKKAEG